MGWIRRITERRAGQVLNRAAGHDFTTQPGGHLLHHSTCPCELGVRALVTRADWRDLAVHPVNSRGGKPT